MADWPGFAPEYGIFAGHRQFGQTNDVLNRFSSGAA
jgi:hypothetical protein